ncbi:MAG: aldo/keto reductase [Lachnospiraceae bacterium]|nr:aldo/keto reductase [Lachnospiraceae bacterium]
MEYRLIDGVDKPVSRLVFGSASGPFSEGRDMCELLDAALEAGINTIDTARVYGMSEKSIGMWLGRRDVRDRVVIISKCAHHDGARKRVSRKDILEDYAVSTDLLGTDYIDIYMLHRDDPEVPVAVSVEVFNELHEQGRIGAFGASNWTHERICEANDYAISHGLIPFTVSSPNFSLAHQKEDPFGGGCVTITGPENAAARAWYEQSQMPVIAYSSLGRGLLTGRLGSGDMAIADSVLDEYAVRGFVCEENFLRLKRCEELAAKHGCSVPQIAMAWLYRQKVNTFAVATMSSPKRIRENIEALSVKLSDEEERYLNLEQ